MAQYAQSPPLFEHRWKAGFSLPGGGVTKKGLAVLLFRDELSSRFIFVCRETTLSTLLGKRAVMYRVMCGEDAYAYAIHPGTTAPRFSPPNSHHNQKVVWCSLRSLLFETICPGKQTDTTLLQKKSSTPITDRQILVMAF
jgi:hypothetical protein